jgi:hypothetical protein
MRNLLIYSGGMRRLENDPASGGFKPQIKRENACVLEKERDTS